MTKTPKWSHPLSATALPGIASGTGSTDDYMVNSVALSDDGKRIIAGTYFYPFDGTQRTRTDGTYGVYCYDAAGHRIWADEFDGDEGVYSVALTPTGQTAVAGGLRKGGRYGKSGPTLAFLRAYSAANGSVLLDYTDPQFNTIVNSVAVSEAGNIVAAATKSSLYVFVKTHAAFPSQPATPFGVTKAIDSVAVSPDGSSFAACGKNGQVYAAAISAGAVTSPSVWIEPAHTHFVSVAVARTAGIFAVAGGSAVYVFKKGSASAGPIARYKLPASLGAGIRFVSVSDDGKLITAVANQGAEAGVIFALSFDGTSLSEVWHFPTALKPNSTTMDRTAKFFTLAEGYPDDVPGSFSLFSETGRLWECPTPKMNWPMVISADGSGIAGGGDDNKLYYFVP